MKSTWMYLRQLAQQQMQRCPWPRRPGDEGEGELELRLGALPKRYSLSHWGLPEHEAAPPDRACAAFCACVAITLSVNNPAVSRASVEDHVHDLRRLADALRETALSEPCIDGRELAGHYLAVIGDLRDRADFIEAAAQRHSSHLIERSSSARGGYRRPTPDTFLASGSDNVRVLTRKVALETQKIFGSSLYTIVATTMSTALDLDVSVRSVRNWCDGDPANKIRPN